MALQCGKQRSRSGYVIYARMYTFVHRTCQCVTCTCRRVRCTRSPRRKIRTILKRRRQESNEEAGTVCLHKTGICQARQNPPMGPCAASTCYCADAVTLDAQIPTPSTLPGKVRDSECSLSDWCAKRYCWKHARSGGYMRKQRGDTAKQDSARF